MSSQESDSTVPVALRVHLAHAAVQGVADASGSDVLHIKGPSVDPALRPEDHESQDADILVRPRHLNLLQRGLRQHGWQQVSGLRSGGLVEHSTNWYHPQLGQLDIHVRFPGIQLAAGRAFDVLWRDRGSQEIARWNCVVPGVTGQRLIMLLHAARSLRNRSQDVQQAWGVATEAERTQIRGLAGELRADVALAAATGRLDNYRDRPEHDLWRMYVDETITTAGFRRMIAEVKAAPEGIDHPHLRVLGYALQIVAFMPRRLANLSGKRPTRDEIVTAYRVFLRRGRDLL